MKKIQTIILDNDETACIAYDQAIKYLQRDSIINEILKQNESLQFQFGDDLLKEQKEHLYLARISADDIDAIQLIKHTLTILKKMNIQDQYHHSQQNQRMDMDIVEKDLQQLVNQLIDHNQMLHLLKNLLKFKLNIIQQKCLKI